MKKITKKSEWQLAGQDLWAIAIGSGCQHDMVTTAAPTATACGAGTGAGPGARLTLLLRRYHAGLDDWHSRLSHFVTAEGCLEELHSTRSPEMHNCNSRGAKRRCC